MTSEALLPTALQKTLEHIIERTNKSDAGIQAILLSTTDGVPLGRVYASGQSLDEEALSSIESVWAPASKQLPLLGLKNPKQVTAMYEYGTLIHVFQMPVVITILCNPHCNLGSVRSCGIPLLLEVLDPLCTTLGQSLKPDYNDNAAHSIQ